MPDIDHIWTEIERLRVQVTRERLEIRQDQKARLNWLAAKAPLARIDELCAERDRSNLDRAYWRPETGHYSLD